MSTETALYTLRIPGTSQATNAESAPNVTCILVQAGKKESPMAPRTLEAEQTGAWLQGDVYSNFGKAWPISWDEYAMPASWIESNSPPLPLPATVPCIKTWKRVP